MLSDDRIRKLSKEFICVKVDPRSPGEGKTAFEFKSTQYVPEVVFLAPDLEVLGRLEGRSPDEVLAEMQAALDAAKSSRRR